MASPESLSGISSNTLTAKSPSGGTHMDRKVEIRILEEMAAEVGKAKEKFKADLKLVGFLATIGKSYKNDLMIYGRALNGGFYDGRSPLELADDTISKQFANDALRDEATERGCPMRWVTDNTPYSNRSAFWRVAKQLVGKLKIGEISTQEWPSVLAWSNLYKIAPEEEGNPSERLCGIQEPKCLELFSTELSTLGSANK
jgi:hypothetical protein